MCMKWKPWGLIKPTQPAKHSLPWYKTVDKVKSFLLAHASAGWMITSTQQVPGERIFTKWFFRR